MDIKTDSRVTFKLFVGCIITAELRMHLNQCSQWKQAKIAPSLEKDLEETHFHQKDYIGLFLTTDIVNLASLKEAEMRILKMLKSYCPDFASEKIRILVFSQVFIS